MPLSQAVESQKKKGHIYFFLMNIFYFGKHFSVLFHFPQTLEMSSLHFLDLGKWTSIYG